MSLCLIFVIVLYSVWYAHCNYHIIHCIGVYIVSICIYLHFLIFLFINIPVRLFLEILLLFSFFNKFFIIEKDQRPFWSGLFSMFVWLLLCVLQIVTVNCARIIHANQVSTNGAVHIIDRVISAVGNSIRDVIQSNEELSLLHVCVVAYTIIAHLF